MSLHHSTVLSAVYERWTEWVLPLFNKGSFLAYLLCLLLSSTNLTLSLLSFLLAGWKIKETETDASLLAASEKRFQAILISTVAQIHYYKFTQKGAVCVSFSFFSAPFHLFLTLFPSFFFVSLIALCSLPGYEARSPATVFLFR
jgi:hypothetical protein